MSDYTTILVARDGRVGIITLNRPKALNALNSELMTDVVTAATELDADAEIGAIVITGSERAFAAGADIKEMSSQSYADVVGQQFFAGWDQLTRLRTPIIAAVTGYALGGGCELAMLCDFIVAGENAVFGQPEINLGVIPGIGGSQRLTRAVGKSKAMDMVLTGRQMKVDEAERAGLVSRVVPTAEALSTAIEAARVIAGKVGTGVGRCQRCGQPCLRDHPRRRRTRRAGAVLRDVRHRRPNRRDGRVCREA